MNYLRQSAAEFTRLRFVLVCWCLKRNLVQLGTHAQLLSEFASGTSAFLDDIQATNVSDRVTVMAFSEFGRRVKENAAEGTDHGTAGPVFLA